MFWSSPQVLDRVVVLENYLIFAEKTPTLESILGKVTKQGPNKGCYLRNFLEQQIFWNTSRRLLLKYFCSVFYLKRNAV